MKPYTWVENRKKRVGIMKLYKHRYPQTEQSVGHSEERPQERSASAQN